MTSFPATWSDIARRRQEMEQAALSFNRRQREKGSSYTVRFLGPEDEVSLVSLSMKVTRDTPAFTAVLRLSTAQMEYYWRALCKVALRDREAFAIGVAHEGELHAAATLGTVAFPTVGNTARFLGGLLLGLGPVGLWRYLRAIHGYEKLLELGAEERSTTIRFIWLYADPDRQGGGCGSRMIRFVIPLCRRLGFARIQGAVDAQDERLNRFYARFGGVHGRRAHMSGVEIVETLRTLDDVDPDQEPRTKE